MDFSRYKGVIFDLDGTLLDSMGVWRTVDRTFLAKRGIPLPPDYADALRPLNYEQAASYTKRRFSLKDSIQDIIREWDEDVLAAYRRGLPLKPGAAAFLKRLKARGVKVGLATASSKELYEAGLKTNGVYSYFDTFTTLDEAPLRPKSFPDIYLLAAKKLGLSPKDCVVFEDILDGIRGAKAAGMAACAVYDACSEPEKGEIRALADAYYPDFTEVDW